MAEASPFLKWAGGKGKLLAQLRPLLPDPLPETFEGRYFEPFLGGGALFFNLEPPRAVLTDVNAELIECYRAVQRDVEGVIALLEAHVHDADAYYAVRAQQPASLDPAARAARTIYLNKAGYNGLYRVNASGGFNVPFGSYKEAAYRSRGNLANLRACAQALTGVELGVESFDAVARRARQGDFVYFDPPYVPLEGSRSFTAYSAGGFGRAEQERLAAVFAELTDNGVHAMLSNSDTPDVRRLYGAYRVDSVLARRDINSRGGERGVIRELVVRNYAPAKASARARRTPRA